MQKLKYTPSALFYLNFALGKYPQVEEMKMLLDRNRKCERRFDKAKALLPPTQSRGRDMVTQTDL